MYCASCGAGRTSEGPFCQGCGARWPGPEAMADAKAAPPSPRASVHRGRSGALRAIAGGLVLLALGAGAGLYFRDRPTPAPAPPPSAPPTAATPAIAAATRPEPAAADVPVPPPALPLSAGFVPPELQGQWTASSSTSMAITGDLELTPRGLKTSQGEIALLLKPVSLASAPGQSWLSPLSPMDFRVLQNRNRFCAEPARPDPVRWLVANLGEDGALMIYTYSSADPPQVLEPDAGYCGNLRYDVDE